MRIALYFSILLLQFSISQVLYMQLIGRNKLIFGTIVVFLLQSHLTLDIIQPSDYVKFGMPFLLLFVSLMIFIRYNDAIVYYPDDSDQRPKLLGLLGALLGLLSLFLCYEELRKLFLDYPEPIKYSDVIPQLETMYDRFASGDHVYYPVDLPTHSPFPVYLPVNWLPVGIARALRIDVRWVGIIFLAAPFAAFGWYIFRKNIAFWLKLILVFLPSVVLWSRIIPHKFELTVSLETLIAAYYMILAVGLVSKNLPLTIVGIVLCFLSRYTLVFWFPLFAYMLWVDKPRKHSFIAWGILAISSIIVLFPFFLTCPDCFTDGLKYHNDCAIAEMTGYGDPNISWSHEAGVYFAAHFKALLPGSGISKAFWVRFVQASLMILLNVIGILGYRKVRHKVDIYKYGLGYLYLVMLIFYMFSPLTYRYYYIPVFMVSAVLVADTCIAYYRKTINS